MGYRALSPAAIERPRQRNPGICPDIIEWVYRAVSPAAPKRPRQRNPDVQSEIIHVSMGLFAIRQVDLAVENGIARPESIA